MSDHFDDTTRAVITAAAAAARECGHAQVGVGHLIVGLLAVPDTAPGDALASLGLTAAAASARLSALPCPGGPLIDGLDMFDPAAVDCLRAAASDAHLLGEGTADPSALARCVLASGHADVGAVLGPRVLVTAALDALDAQDHRTAA